MKQVLVRSDVSWSTAAVVGILLSMSCFALTACGFDGGLDRTQCPPDLESEEERLQHALQKITEAPIEDFTVSNDCDDGFELAVGYSTSSASDISMWERELRRMEWSRAELDPIDAAPGENAWKNSDGTLAVVILSDDALTAGTTIDIELFVPHSS